MEALDKCISPYSREEFFACWWERCPLLVRERQSVGFGDLISTHSIDNIVACTNLRYPYFRLFKSGRLVSPADTTVSRQVGPDRDNGLADLNAIYDHYADGGTVVLQAMERWWPPLTDFCRRMASDLGFPTQAYVYLAPSRAHGSPAHYDTHEVFALQVEGSKAWKVWGDVKRLPMRVSANEYDTQLVQQYARDHEPVLEVLLKPGDVLYIPRGFVHAAQAGDEGSVHVSIGVMVYRWIDVIQSVVEAALRKCSQDVHYKESLPLGRPPGAPLDASAAATLDLLTTSFVSDLALQEGLTILRAEFADYLKPPLRHRLTDTLALAGVTANARIPMRPDFAFNNGSRS